MRFCPTNIGRIAWQSKRKSVREGGYCCTDKGVLSKRMLCKLRLQLRGLNHKQSQAIFPCKQVAVSDRRRQFDGWNVGFRNHIGPFDLGFHSRCNNNHNMNGSPNLNQYNSPGLYHHTNQNWNNYWLHACPGGSTPDFKWQGWSNGGNNQNPQKSLRLQTKPPKNPWTKIQPPKPFYLTCIVTEKPHQGGVNKLLYCIVSHAEFPSHKNFQKALMI